MNKGPAFLASDKCEPPLADTGPGGPSHRRPCPHLHPRWLAGPHGYTAGGAGRRSDGQRRSGREGRARQRAGTRNAKGCAPVRPPVASRSRPVGPLFFGRQRWPGQYRHRKRRRAGDSHPGAPATGGKLESAKDITRTITTQAAFEARASTAGPRPLRAHAAHTMFLPGVCPTLEGWKGVEGRRASVSREGWNIRGVGVLFESVSSQARFSSSPKNEGPPLSFCGPAETHPVGPALSDKTHHFDQTHPPV